MMEQQKALNNTRESKWQKMFRRLVPGARLLELAKEHWKFTLVLIAIVIGIAVAVVKMVYNTASSFSIEHSDRIDITPEEIRSIENIGEWEFLSVNMEELVDTVSKGFFGTSTLARIYKGTIRIGLDMSECKDGWIMYHGDTLQAQLPAIKVLDKNFIDEANTRAFYEDGSWTAADKERMYQKAHRLMMQKGFTKANRKTAEENARKQLTQFFCSFGYNTVELTFNNK